MTALSVRVTLAALTALTLSVTPAEAQWGARANGAHTEGYRDGVRAGNDDARDGRRYEYQRHRDYRSADTGYQSRDGRRDDYRQQYRAGFVAGYRDGFYSSGRRPSSGGAGPWSGGGPWNDRNDERGDDRGGRVVLDVARRNGADDGYKRGLDDGRDRERFDVRQHDRYRDGDRGYRRDYGPRSVYQDAYRNAFERAYRAGYENGQRQRRR